MPRCRYALVAATVAMAALPACDDRTQESSTTVAAASMAPALEAAFGLQAAYTLAREYGDPVGDPRVQDRVKATGGRLHPAPFAPGLPYAFDFRVLNERRRANGFALPGGQILVTVGLVNQTEGDDQLAALLAHLMGHAIGHHAIQHIAGREFSNGRSGVDVLASYRPEDQTLREAPDVKGAIEMLDEIRYTPTEEQAANQTALRLLCDAGYDVRALPLIMRRITQGDGSSEAIREAHPADPGLADSANALARRCPRRTEPPPRAR